MGPPVRKGTHNVPPVRKGHVVSHNHVEIQAHFAGLDRAAATMDGWLGSNTAGVILCKILKRTRLHILLGPEVG